MKQIFYYRGMSKSAYQNFKKEEHGKRRRNFLLLAISTVLVVTVLIVSLYMTMGRGDRGLVAIESEFGQSESAASSKIKSEPSFVISSNSSSGLKSESNFETQSEPSSETKSGSSSKTESKPSFGSETEPRSETSTESVFIQDELRGDFFEWNRSCDWALRVVNSQNSILNSNPIAIKKYDIIDVDERIYKPLVDMISAARRDGVVLWISSGYRSVETQRVLYEREVKKYYSGGKSLEEAKRLAALVVAPPGTSEHGLGLAIDFNGVRNDFYETGAYQWLSAHSAEYGFVERYPNGKQEVTGIIFEPWHYRYVGVENAQRMKELGMCLEEYVYSLMA